MKKKEFIIQDLLSKIFQGQFIEGQIPNQRKLAEMYKVSRFTIQKAIKNLEEIGVVEVIQGSGMYINKKWVKNPLIFNSLTQTPYDRIESKMLSLEKSLASHDEKQIFQLSDGEEVWTFKRLRIVNFIIEQIELSKMPVPLFPDLSKEVVEHSIQKYVEKKGYCISHYISTYVPVSISKEQSHYLMCKKGTPAMQIINRGILENGVIYEYSDITAIDYSATYIRPFDREVHQARID